MNSQGIPAVTGLSHAAIRVRDIEESFRFYTGVLGLKEAFRMVREDGSLGTVYLFLAPGQYLELFAGSCPLTRIFLVLTGNITVMLHASRSLSS